MRIRLIVPNVNRNTSPVVAYGKAIADIAGGFTATQATGGWIGPQGLVVEPVTVFDCRQDGSADKETARRTELHIGDMFRYLARRIGQELRQDCVYLEIDGIVELVKP